MQAVVSRSPKEFDIHHPRLSLRNRGKYRHETKQP